MRKPPPETGVELITGLPGSGKSMYAVERLIHMALQERRPVFTNLPLRFRVVSRYMRIVSGDDRLTRYIRPLTPEHLHAFIKRFNLLRTWRDERRNQGLAFGDEFFIKEHGPNVLGGHSANWIPYTSIMVIDEAHHPEWFPETFKQGTKENPAILSYLSMHRHALHWLWLLTQHPMQVSVSVRRQTKKFITCVDASQLPFLFGLCLPFRLHRVSEFPGAYAMDGKPESFGPPIAAQTVIPALRSGVVFRLYDSHTHCGSQTKMLRSLEQMRTEIEEGLEVQQLPPPPEGKARRNARIFKKYWLILPAILAFIIYLMLPANKPEPVPAKVKAGPTAPPAKAPQKEEAHHVQLTAVSEKSIVLGRKVYRIGDVVTYEGANYRLLGVNPEDGAAVLTDGKVAVSLRVGVPPLVRTIPAPGAAGNPSSPPPAQPRPSAPSAPSGLSGGRKPNP